MQRRVKTRRDSATPIHDMKHSWARVIDSNGRVRRDPRSILGRVTIGHVLLVAVLLRASLFLLSTPWSPEVVAENILRSDSKGYHELATGLLHLGTFVDEPIRTPMYVLYLAGTYSIVGEHPAAAIALQIVLDILICYVCYRLTKRLVGHQAGIVAAIFYAIDPTAILYANVLMSDTLFTFLFIISFVLLYRGLTTVAPRASVGWYALSGIAVGMATLTRPVALYALPLFIVAAVWGEWPRVRGGLARTVAIVVAFAVTIAPWVYRNHRVYGVVGVSSSGAYNLFYLYAVHTEMIRTGASVPQAIENVYASGQSDPLGTPGLNVYRQHQELGDIAERYLLEHPGWFLLATGLGLAQMYGNTGSGGYSQHLGLRRNIVDVREVTAHPNVVKGADRALKKKTLLEKVLFAGFMVVHLIEYGLIIYGAWMLRRHLRKPVFIAMISFIVGYSLLIGAAGLMRFKLPVVPLYLVFAGVGGCALLLHRRAPEVAPVLERHYPREEKVPHLVVK